MTSNEQVRALLKSAQEYSDVACRSLVQWALIETDGIAKQDISIKTTYLFPTLKDSERSALCRLRYLVQWLHQARAVNFSQWPQPYRSRYQKLRRRLSAEHKILKSRCQRPEFLHNLTKVQRQIVRNYMSAGTNRNEFGHLLSVGWPPPLTA